MKRISVVILALLIALAVFTACTNKQSQENTNDNSEMVLKLSDNLPEFTIYGNYTKGEMYIEEDTDGDFDMLWAYDGDDDAEYRYVRAYKWSAGNMSLFDATKADAQLYYPDQEPEVIICNFWNEPGDYEYTYYSAIKNDKLMMQIWTFHDGDYFYQICVGYDLITYNVPGTDLQYSIPKHLKETKSEGALKAFVDPDYESNMSEFPNVEIYLNDGEYDFSPENIAETWGVENVEVAEHEYTTNDKSTKLPGYRILCEYTENGKTLVCRQDSIKFGDKYFGITFLYNKDLEFSDYIENSYRAFLYTISEK